jgi:hypothetical protein
MGRNYHQLKRPEPARALANSRHGAWPAPSPAGRQDDASGGRERSDPAAGQQILKNQAGMPMALLPEWGNSGAIEPGGTSNGRHATQSGSRSALTAGPCSNSLVPICGFQVPQRITRCAVPGAPGLKEADPMDAMAPGAAFRSSDPQPIPSIAMITKR